jgi:hypothetical protein
MSKLESERLQALSDPHGGELGPRTPPRRMKEREESRYREGVNRFGGTLGQSLIKTPPPKSLCERTELRYVTLAEKAARKQQEEARRIAEFGGGLDCLKPRESALEREKREFLEAQERFRRAAAERMGSDSVVERGGQAFEDTRKAETRRPAHIAPIAVRTVREGRVDDVQRGLRRSSEVSAPSKRYVQGQAWNFAEEMARPQQAGGRHVRNEQQRSHANVAGSVGEVTTRTDPPAAVLKSDRQAELLGSRQTDEDKIPVLEKDGAKESAFGGGREEGAVQSIEPATAMHNKIESEGDVLLVSEDARTDGKQDVMEPAQADDDEYASERETLEYMVAEQRARLAAMEQARRAQGEMLMMENAELEPDAGGCQLPGKSVPEGQTAKMDGADRNEGERKQDEKHTNNHPALLNTQEQKDMDAEQAGLVAALEQTHISDHGGYAAQATGRQFLWSRVESTSQIHADGKVQSPESRRPDEEDESRRPDEEDDYSSERERLEYMVAEQRARIEAMQSAQLQQGDMIVPPQDHGLDEYNGAQEAYARRLEDPGAQDAAEGRGNLVDMQTHGHGERSEQVDDEMHGCMEGRAEEEGPLGSIDAEEQQRLADMEQLQHLVDQGILDRHQLEYMLAQERARLAAVAQDPGQYVEQEQGYQNDEVQLLPHAEGYQDAGYAGPEGYQDAGYAGPEGYQDAGYAGPEGYKDAGYAGPEGYKDAGYAGHQGREYVRAAPEEDGGTCVGHQAHDGSEYAHAGAVHHYAAVDFDHDQSADGGAQYVHEAGADAQHENEHAHTYNGDAYDDQARLAREEGDEYASEKERLEYMVAHERERLAAAGALHDQEDLGERDGAEWPDHVATAQTDAWT